MAQSSAILAFAMASSSNEVASIFLGASSAHLAGKLSLFGTAFCSGYLLYWSAKRVAGYTHRFDPRYAMRFWILVSRVHVWNRKSEHKKTGFHSPDLSRYANGAVSVFLMLFGLYHFVA